MKLAFHPAFTHPAPLADRYWRAVHYLGAVAGALDEVDVRTNLPLPPSPPDYLDQSLPAREAALRQKLRLRPANAALVEADIVIVWDLAHRKDEALKDAREVVILDPAMLHEGDLWIELGARISPRAEAARGGAQAMLLSHCRSAQADIVHLFGTGPSLQHVNVAGLPDGPSIVCNSMVKNARFLGVLKPALITAVDPIFHAGASRHAGAFRQALISALRDCDEALFVVQERDAHLYSAALPEDVRGRVVAVPVRHSLQPNMDLARRFEFTATRNVLTLALLPLAALLGSEIRIYGCDGRPVEENTHFWGYEAATVFAPELEQQRLAHPGFYALNYDEYYALHCETTRLWLRALERRGVRVCSATPSHIPALAVRSLQDSGAEPEASLNLALAGRLAYAKRTVQSLYGAVLANNRIPVWGKRGLQSLVAGAKVLSRSRRINRRKSPLGLSISPPCNDAPSSSDSP